VAESFPKWWFPRKPANQKANENSNGEHFRTLDTEHKAQAFVREAFQNSIDGAAVADGVVRIRIFLSGPQKALPSAIANKYFDRFFEHLAACSNEIPVDVAVMKASACKFLVLEDFGTTGLTGDPLAWDEGVHETENNHFYHFFRTVGRSGKSGENLGRWGIGKFVFMMASEARAIFGLTIRREVSGETSELLMGQSTLRYHSLDGQSYVNDGWFATESVEESLALPVSNADLLASFRTDWSLSRADQTGLSVVVPYVEGIDEEDLLYSVVSEYCGKILEGRLEIELEFGSRNQVIVINQASIRHLIGEKAEEARWKAIARVVDAIEWYLAEGKEQAIDLLQSGIKIRRPDWSQSPIRPEGIEEARTQLELTGRIAVRIPVEIKAKKVAGHAQSYMDVVFQLQENQSQRAAYTVFFRKWLRISGRKMGSAINGVDSYLIVGDGILGSLLGDAEGPAHTEWADSRERFKDRYDYGPNWLTFVKQSPRKIADIILGKSHERDIHAFEDLFPRPKGESKPAQNGSGNGKDDDGKGRTTKPPLPPPGNPPGLILNPVHGGFKIRCDKVSQISRFEVEVAYDTRTGNPFAKWHPADFLIEGLTMRFANQTGSLVSSDKNRFTVDVFDVEAFELEVTGFDGTRDIHVKAVPVGGGE
jgi:hypothetical protein